MQQKENEGATVHVCNAVNTNESRIIGYQLITIDKSSLSNGATAFLLKHDSIINMVGYLSILNEVQW